MCGSAVMHKLLQKVQHLGLPDNDFAVFGSGPLLVRRIIDQVGDIDILCRDSAWRAALSMGDLLYLDEYDLEVISIDDGLITLGRSWAYGDFNVDELIDSAEQINGLPFVQLRYVIAYKLLAGRPKDLVHLQLLRDRGLWQGA
jgi:hypothetical protein